MMRGPLLLGVLILMMVIPRSHGASLDSQGFYAKPFLVPVVGTHTAPINQIDTDAVGKFLVTGSDDKSIRVWSQASGHMLRVIRVAAGLGFTGRIYAVALSPDGTRIAAGGFTDAHSSASHIYIFDRATGQQLGLLGGLPSVVNQLAFSPDGTRLAAVLGGTNGVRLYDVRRMQQIAVDTDYGDSSHGVAFDHGGRLVTTSFDGKIRLYTPELRRVRVAVAPGGAQPLGVAFRPSGSLLAIGYFGSPHVDIVDATTLTRIQAADTNGVGNGDLARVAWSPDGVRLFAAGSWQRSGRLSVRIWLDNGRHILGDYTAAENTITGLRALPDGTLAVASGDPRVTVLDRDGATRWAVTPQTADYRGQESSLAVAPDGTRVRFDFDTTRPMPAELDLHQRQLNINPPRDPTLSPARTDGLHAVWLNTNAPTLDGKPLALDPHETSRSMAIEPDGTGFVLGAEWSLRHFKRDGTPLWRIAAPGVVWAVNIPSDGKVVIAACSDGTIRWYRLSDGVELLAFFPRRDGKRWVVWTPLGYYLAPPGGEELIQWQIDRGQSDAPDVVSAARFRERFYRPVVVEQVLAELDPVKALAAADRQIGRPTVVQNIAGETPPRVTIIDPADNTFVDHGDIAVFYKVEDRPGTPIQQVRLLLGGQLIGTQDNLLIPDSGHLSSELHARLSGTGELLTLVAVSGNGQSDPAKVQIRRPVSRASAKSSLYVLAVGIGHFQDKKVPTLDYPAKDAMDFAAQMRAQQGGLYDKVLVRTLVEQDATNRAVMDGLFWLEREMQQSDVAAIFISTHGQNDATGKFYLLPYDISVEDEIDIRRTALRYSDLRDTLSRLADRGKVLIFLDACHSGNVIPGAKGMPTDVDEVAADLASSENGAVVFSSSTGRQLSLERPELGHGVFTYALLEALGGKASRDPPWLYVSDLEVWLAKEVKKLTNGAQTPQTTLPRERLIDPRIFQITSAMRP